MKSNILSNTDINRIISAAGDDPSAPEARILVLSISPDASMAYVPIMNAIFSAQKLVFVVLSPTPSM
jgi:hypothetical protein